MFTPDFTENKALYFYGNLNFKKSVLEYHPIDSITFKKSEYGGYEINTAPPWLVPNHLKLDYGILYFKLQSVTQDFAEVTVNRLTGRTAFVDKFQGKIAYWPEFFLGVHSVEFLNKVNKSIFIKPLKNTSKVNIPHRFIKPLRITNEWMNVQLLDDDFKTVGQGWVKWIDGGNLLIKYSLLS